MSIVRGAGTIEIWNAVHAIPTSWDLHTFMTVETTAEERAKLVADGVSNANRLSRRSATQAELIEHNTKAFVEKLDSVMKDEQNKLENHLKLLKSGDEEAQRHGFRSAFPHNLPTLQVLKGLKTLLGTDYAFGMVTASVYNTYSDSHIKVYMPTTDEYGRQRFKTAQNVKSQKQLPIMNKRLALFAVNTAIEQRELIDSVVNMLLHSRNSLFVMNRHMSIVETMKARIANFNRNNEALNDTEYGALKDWLESMPQAPKGATAVHYRPLVDIKRRIVGVLDTLNPNGQLQVRDARYVASDVTQATNQLNQLTTMVSSIDNHCIGNFSCDICAPLMTSEHGIEVREYIKNATAQQATLKADADKLLIEAKANMKQEVEE